MATIGKHLIAAETAGTWKDVQADKSVADGKRETEEGVNISTVAPAESLVIGGPRTEP